MVKPPQIGGQVHSELDELIIRANKLQPTSYLEIGAREGIAMRYFVERVPSIKRVTVVDLPGAKWGRDDSEVALHENLNALDSHTQVYLGRSDDDFVVDEVSRLRYSIVFIDADHSYEGVSNDFEIYGPLATDMICLHDINHPPDSNAYGPTRLWLEVKDDDTDVAIIAAGSRKGIGVIYV